MVAHVLHRLPHHFLIRMGGQHQCCSLNAISALPHNVRHGFTAHAGNGNAARRFIQCVQTIGTDQFHPVFQTLLPHLFSCVLQCLLANVRKNHSLTYALLQQIARQ